jgi:peroxiredoxin
MIETGSQAPDFTLNDQFGRSVSSAAFRDRKHLMLLFYPLDFTPT